MKKFIRGLLVLLLVFGSIWIPSDNGQYQRVEAHGGFDWKQEKNSNINADYSQTIAIKSNGNVVGVGNNSDGQLNVSGWTDIVEVDTSNYHSLGLRANGTVVGTGVNFDGQINVGSWTDIVEIAAGAFYSLGLKSNGTVVGVGSNNNNQLNVGSWTEIVAIAASQHSLGLRANGTVLATGANHWGQLNVGSWTNIVAITVGTSNSLGLKTDGTVVGVGYNASGQLNVSDWTDIVSIAAGSNHSIGLKADGTVVGVGDNNYGQLNVGSWTNIIAIAAGLNHSIGLKADGTVVGVGNNASGQLNVSDWTDIRIYNRNPETVLSQPTDNLALSEVSGFNSIPISGTVRDEDVGDILTVRYSIGSLPGHQNIALTPNITANGSNQSFSRSVDVNSTIPEGTHTLRVWVEDDKGGISDEVTRTIIVDKTAPSVSFGTNGNTSWAQSHSTTVNVTDSRGVSSRHYMWTTSTSTPAWNGGTGWTSFNNGATIQTPPSVTGNYYLHIRTVDGVGNIRNIQTNLFRVDNTLPTINANPESRTDWDNTTVNIDVAIADGHAGVSTRQYQLTQSATPTASWQNAGSNNFTVNVNTEGEWHLHVRATDGAGNTNTASYGVYRYFVLSAPSSIMITETTTSSMRIGWNQLADHEYRVQLKNQSGTVIFTSGWGVNSDYVFSSLSSNSRYTPEVQSRRHGKLSNWIAATPQYTDANPITKATYESGDRTVRVILDINSTGNPIGTEYLIRNIQTNQTSPAIQQEWLNDQLVNDMAYTYMGKVVQRNGKEGEWFLLGTGYTAQTQVVLPPEWENPVGGLPAVNLPGEFDPDNMNGKVVMFNGKPAIVVVGRYINISIENIENADKYAVSLTGYGYSDWKDLDANNSFSESIFINDPGFYPVHIKFKNQYGMESESFVRNFLVDWIAPNISTEQTVKGQTATTSGTFSVRGYGEDNLSPVLYNSGSGWQWYAEGATINATVPLNNQRNTVVFRFSDLNGNITTREYRIWGLNN